MQKLENHWSKILTVLSDWRFSHTITLVVNIYGVWTTPSSFVFLHILSTRIYTELAFGNHIYSLTNSRHLLQGWVHWELEVLFSTRKWIAPIKAPLRSSSSLLSLIPGNVLSPVCFTALHLHFHCLWKPGHHHSGPAECSPPHSHVLLHQHPFFPGDLVHHIDHTKDVHQPAAWKKEHFLKWLSPAHVFLPFHWHQWGLSLDSYGIWPLPGHL